MDALNHLRQEIDALDRELIQLFAKRLELVSQVGEIKHTNNELATHVILDPYIISYVLAGFLWGHVALHHDVTKVSRLASSMAISLIPRLTVLVGAIFFIGLALIIIMVPITWDGVLDTLTKK